MSQSAQPSRIVIVGASLAGGSAAVALREQGYTGELTLIGDEVHRPYERPPLSKALMQGEVDEPDWVADEAFWDLDGPIVRITTPHIPLPAADHLEDLALPSAARVAETVRRVLNG